MNEIGLLRLLPSEAIRQMEKPARVRTQTTGANPRTLLPKVDAHQAHRRQQSGKGSPEPSIQTEGRYVGTSMATGRNGRARFREQSGDVIDLGAGGRASYFQQDKGANGFVDGAASYRIHDVPGSGKAFFNFDAGGGTMHRPTVGGDGFLAQLGSFIGRCVIDPKTGDVKQ